MCDWEKSKSDYKKEIQAEKKSFWFVLGVLGFAVGMGIGELIHYYIFL